MTGLAIASDDERSKLVRFVLQQVILHELLAPGCIEEIIKPSGGLGGDPDWEIDHVPDANGLGYFTVRAGSYYTGFNLEIADYPAGEFINTMKEVLIDYPKQYPYNKAKALAAEEKIASLTTKLGPIYRGLR